MTADLDTLLTALYVELTDQIIPFRGPGQGHCASHSRGYWGCKLLLICTCDATVTGFSLANPKLHGASGTTPGRPCNASRRTGPRPAPPSSKI